MLLLLERQIPNSLVKWIMGCVTTPYFLYLINGSTSNFFKPIRGLNNSFYPLISLVVEGLSRAINEAKRLRTIQGGKVGEGGPNSTTLC